MKPAREYYTSPISEFCAEQLPGDFHFLDGDEVLFRHSAQPILFARENGTLRLLESKLPGEEIRRSQRETLPLLAGALAMAARAELVAPTSGVYVVEGRPPWSDGALVSRVRPARSPIDWQAIGIQFDLARRLTFAQLCAFVRCRPVGP